VILAGDALPYFGDLTPLFPLVVARLAPRGRFVFSVELLDGADTEGRPWRLGRLGRYAHSHAHIAAAAEAAGLAVMSAREEAVRLESGVPVTGLIVVLEGPSA
jgi:predicted TPR repeat methyltransferase